MGYGGVYVVLYRLPFANFHTVCIRSDIYCCGGFHFCQKSPLGCVRHGGVVEFLAAYLGRGNFISCLFRVDMSLACGAVSF